MDKVWTNHYILYISGTITKTKVSTYLSENQLFKINLKLKSIDIEWTREIKIDLT